MEDGSYLD
jgi:hypothetical protein